MILFGIIELYIGGAMNRSIDDIKKESIILSNFYLEVLQTNLRRVIELNHLPDMTKVDKVCRDLIKEIETDWDTLTNSGQDFTEIHRRIGYIQGVLETMGLRIN